MLSLWWTLGERDDIFWRSAASGARAKVRSYVGKKTFGQYGDITAIDPIGNPLTTLATLELKRGYGNASFGDMLDKGQKQAKQPWEMWMEQVLLDQKNAGVYGWLLITRRDRREAVIFMPWTLYELLNMYGASLDSARPWLKFRPISVNRKVRKTVFATTLCEFLSRVSPDTIVKASKDGEENE
jgi:hypothetical protein